MVLAGISLHTKTDMVRIAGKLNTARYRDNITRPVLPPTYRQMVPWSSCMTPPAHAQHEVMFDFYRQIISGCLAGWPVVLI